jgi:putative heme-binding domain-containing protein
VEHDPDTVAAILESMSDLPGRETRERFWEIVVNRTGSVSNRLRSLALWAAAAGDSSEHDLAERVASLEDGPVLAEALKYVGRWRRLGVSSILVDKLKSPAPTVRVAAIDALAELRVANASESVSALLRDQDAGVRRAAAAAAGTLGVASALELLLKVTMDADPAVRRAALDALRQLREPRAVPLAVGALSDRETEVAALRCIGELGGPKQARAVAEHARQNPSADVLPLAVQVLSDWAGRTGLPPAQQSDLQYALAEIQGASGALICWQVTGPVPVEVATALVGRLARPGIRPEPSLGVKRQWQTRLAARAESALRLDLGKDPKGAAVWLAVTDLAVPEATAGELLVSGDGGMRVWLNGRPIRRPDTMPGRGPASSQVDAMLAAGTNRLLVEVVASQSAEFHLGFRRRSSSADREKLMQAALISSGDPARGRKIFFDAEKSQCLKCHQVGGHGERIGPELTGVGSRFSRVFIIESILEPGRIVAPSYGSVIVALKDGRVFSGVPTAQTELTLTLADQQGQRHVLDRSGIEKERPQSQSTMPEGLEKRFTTAEFIDLIEFLAAQK